MHSCIFGQNMAEEWNYKNLLHYLQSEKIINKTKSTIPVVKSLSYWAPRTLAKAYDKLISRKLVPRDDTQLKARYLCKTTESQLAWRSRINLKIHENAIR